MWVPVHVQIVILGATGNLGTALVDLVSAAADVTSVVAVARRPAEIGSPKVRFVPADITRDDLRAVVRGADVVVHLAWAIQPMRRPSATWTVNVGGLHRLLEAMSDEAVPALVYASSLGAYSARDPRGPDPRVDEGARTAGIGGVAYSMEKAYDERLLDAFELEHPTCRVVRLRPGLVLQRPAGQELGDLFAGPVVRAMLRAITTTRAPAPLPADLRFQVVHAKDVAAAVLAACRRPVSGAFNLAAEPVVDRAALAEALGARAIGLPWWALRGAGRAAFAARLSPLHPSWIDLIHLVPLMDTSRARDELGWTPSHDAHSALRDAVAGVLGRESRDTAPMS